MPSAYRLLPAHRRKIRRMRALVEVAISGPDHVKGSAPTTEELAEAEEYLTTHASCEAYLLALASGAAPVERPRCAQGLGRKAKVSAPTTSTRMCPVCNKVKSVIAFDDELGKCIKCKYKALDEGKARKPSGSEGRMARPTRTRKCPVCLQGVTAVLAMGEWAVEPHAKLRSDGLVECGGSGTVLFREKRDAMDRIVPGSFEGGRRR